MQNKNSKYEFIALLIFLVGAALLLTNGFDGRISAQSNKVDTYQKIEPIGDVLAKILEEYVGEADIDRVVEGALRGMMGALDRHSSYIAPKDLSDMREDTKGEFEGIGVSIKEDEDGNIFVFYPVADSPALRAGMKSLDRIVGIDGVPVSSLRVPLSVDPTFSLLEAVANLIKGPRGSMVKLTVERFHGEDPEPEVLEFKVKRAKVPLESLKEARMLEGGIGYIRIGDFKDNTARDLRDRLDEFSDEGLNGLVIDLRWNPGGLLTASKEVCELLLAKDSLVTHTKGRKRADGKPNGDDMELFTESRPILPLTLSMVVLVNEQSASSSEIVTGALQYHQRAIILGEKTFGKGSVQTIIPLKRPTGSALRLTTALYYTPGDVTINLQGIIPDIEVEMTNEQEEMLFRQFFRSYEDDPSKMNAQNHGSVTGDTVTHETAEELMTALKEIRELGEGDRKKRLKAITVEDLQLRRAVEILREEKVWDTLLAKYHRDVRETQIEALNGEDVESTIPRFSERIEEPFTLTPPEEFREDEEPAEEVAPVPVP